MAEYSGTPLPEAPSPENSAIESGPTFINTEIPFLGAGHDRARHAADPGQSRLKRA